MGKTIIALLIGMLCITGPSSDVRAELVSSTPPPMEISDWIYQSDDITQDVRVIVNDGFTPTQYQVIPVDGYFLGTLEIKEVPELVGNYSLIGEFGITGDIVNFTVFTDENLTHAIATSREGSRIDHTYDFGSLDVGTYYVKIELKDLFPDEGRFINFSVSSDFSWNESEVLTPEPASLLVLGSFALCGLGIRRKLRSR